MSTTYNLAGLTVLVAEDEDYGRTTLVNILRGLGVTSIIAAKDGSHAIEEIKRLGRRGVGPGSVKLDLVIADCFMSPVDGLMLLRWIRQSSESPDRFLPFITISGMANEEVIQNARNLGTTEFLSKPFSVNTLSSRIVSIIENPRDFIYTPDYFGPCRRRRGDDIDFSDRRVGAHEVEYIDRTRGPDDVNPNAKVWVFKLPNKLKQSTLNDKDLLKIEEDFSDISPDVLSKATKKLEEMEDDYTDNFAISLREIKRQWKGLNQNRNAHWPYFRRIHKLSSEFRQQGDVFEYDLITVFANSLCHYTRNDMVTVDDKFMDLLKAHIDGMQTVINENIRGHGGQQGAMLRELLDKARDKYDRDSQTSSSDEDYPPYSSL